MKIIKPSVRILTPVGDELLDLIEVAGRTCYKSEHNMSDNSKYKFVSNIYKSGHHSVLEHASVSVRFVCSRGISHEIVRHRLAAFSQESTRYCNYSNDKFNNEITVIYPSWALPILSMKGNLNDRPKFIIWQTACEVAETAYFDMLKEGALPQEARDVLPNALKTELVMTANLREWLHFFKLRCDAAAHPDMQYLAKMLLKKFHDSIPVIFDELYEEYNTLMPFAIYGDEENEQTSSI